MADEQFKAQWEAFLAQVKVRKPRVEKPFKSLETEYPFKYVQPFRIQVVETRAGDVQIKPAHNVSKYRHGQKIRPEKPAYQNMRRKYHAERNDIALEISRVYTG